MGPAHKRSTVAFEVAVAAGAVHTWTEGHASRVMAVQSVLLASLRIAFDLMIAHGITIILLIQHCCYISPVCPSTVRATSPCSLNWWSSVTSH